MPLLLVITFFMNWLLLEQRQTNVFFSSRTRRTIWDLKAFLPHWLGDKFLRRIGLSATPDRQFDDSGNEAIKSFFGCHGDNYTFEFSMREAIDKGYLCRYKYFPHIVRLTDAEMAEYMKVSLQLAKFYNYGSETFPGSGDILMALLLKRKRIVHKAANKEHSMTLKLFLMILMTWIIL